MVRERLRALPRTLARSWPGRLLLAGALAKVLLLPFATDGGSLLVWVDVSASLALAVGLGHLLLQSVARIRRRLLWRVRRKLILSYVFIGFVPVLLVAAFFAVAGAMSVLSASSEIVRREIDGVIADVRVAAAGIGARLSSGMDVPAALQPLGAALRGNYPGASALVLRPVTAGGPASAGPWSGGPRPDEIPEWVGEQGLVEMVLGAVNGSSRGS